MTTKEIPGGPDMPIDLPDMPVDPTPAPSVLPRPLTSSEANLVEKLQWTNVPLKGLDRDFVIELALNGWWFGFFYDPEEGVEYPYIGIGGKSRPETGLKALYDQFVSFQDSLEDKLKLIVILNNWLRVHPGKTWETALWLMRLHPMNNVRRCDRTNGLMTILDLAASVVEVKK